MDNNLLCPSYKCNLMELLPILIDVEGDQEINLLPSQLNKELLMSTEERLERLCKPTRKYRIHTEVDTFSRTPDIVVFQNFEPGLVYKTTLSFLNLHPVSRHLRVVTGNSPHFGIDGPTKDHSAKLAPGMSYTLNVTFSPMENRNYVHHITIITDAESFTVPVYGLCAQALLNLPDHIKLPPTAVNVVSEKKLALHNFGKAATSFIISSKNPFSVSPYKCYLPAGRFMEIKVTCKPLILGHIKDCIYLFYNGIKLMIHVECEVYAINLYLDKDNVPFQEIYMGLKQHESVTIYNRSDHYIKFQWKLNKSREIDQLENCKMQQSFENIKELERRRSTKLEKLNIIDNEGHTNIYEKIFETEVAELKDDDSLYVYQNPAFDIVPLAGRILPNKSQTFIVSFTPNKNQYYESWAYLDVTGRSNRLPLKLSGRGKGPYVSLNVKVLNIGDVFLCATHNYEVAVKNEGCIPATIVFKDCVSDFNSVIKCTPRKVFLQHQDICSAFIISFYSEYKGNFIETIQFMIKESEEIIRLVLTGNVVCPLLKMDIRGLDFGVFPFGTTQTKDFVLTNDCQVPIEYKIVLEENSTTLDSEIEFTPNQGTVKAYSEEPVSVQLKCSRSKEEKTNFKVIMWGSEQYSITRFLNYVCICPNIKCHPSDIPIKFCFLNFEYKRTVTLTNIDNVPGIVIYTPPKAEDNDITCTLSKTKFVIKPHEEEYIELSIATRALGISQLPLLFTVAGTEPQALCRITVDGQGPVISYRPDEIHFNEIILLKTVVQQLTLINDSPIPATVQITKAAEAFFEVDVDKLDIMPDEEKVVKISVYLTDIGKYTGIVNVKVLDGESIDIKVTGMGIGHSLLCDPLLESEYDAHILLTHQQFTDPIKITNMGKRFYKVRWCSYPSIRHLKDKLDKPHQGYAFRIKPEYFELSHLETQVIEIQGLSKEEKQVKEEFFCYALTDNSSKISHVMSLTIKGQFVEPSVSIKKPTLDVLIAENDCLELEDSMAVTNELSVPVPLNVSVSNEYYIVQNNRRQSQLSQRLEAKGILNVMIKFAPNVAERRYFKQTGQLTVGYVNHPNSVKLQLSTEVCFPTVSLDKSELTFSCVPLNSYSYENVIIQNITFLPATYSWEILEEFFEIEKLPVDKGESKSRVDDVLMDLENSVPGKSTKDLDKGKENENGEEKDIVTDEVLSSDIWTSADYVKEMKNVLRPTIKRFVENCNEQDLFEDDNYGTDYDEYHISNILTIEPYRGRLEPYEYGVVTVGFYPPPNTRIRARAVCKVEGGEQEMLLIVGTSCKISYELDKNYVEFGQQLFCEICYNTIVLTNNGFSSFTYFIHCDSNVPDMMTVVDPGWLNVAPKSKDLSPGESITLKIKYFPGMVGEFNKSFKVVIGYLEAFEIKIHGYAVFSQIYACVPRPLIDDQPPELCYKAISTLSKDYLCSMEALRLVFKVPYLDCASEALIRAKLDDDWVIISRNDSFPSIMDIDMSIERMLLREYLLENPNILYLHTFSGTVKVIPDFKTPRYLLDFGYVIVETSVCYTILLYNYGPEIAEVRLVKHSGNLEMNKFKIEYQPKKLNVGDTAHIYVLFNPTLKRYPDPDVCVKENFSLTVTHGATIPIAIHAIVTLPRISFEHECIDFGTVNVGHCLRRSVVIKNDGHVTSNWMVECKKRNTYFVRPHMGELEPGKQSLLEIYFMPMGNNYQPGKLNLFIEGNPNVTSIDLRGYGAGPSLVFDNTDLKFKSALPYTTENSMSVMIQNTAAVPTEFCFLDFDRQYEEERLWINMYFDSHKINCVLVPQRNAGDKLNDVFEDNYLTLIHKLRTQLLSVDSQESDDNSESKLTAEDPDDPLLKFSQDEIAKMLNELIEAKQSIEDSGSTDIQTSSESFFSKVTVVEPHTNQLSEMKESQSGVFIVFHGAPNTEYFKAANKAGITLKVPVYNIDKLIYEALLEEGTYYVNRVNKLINEAFEYVATANDLNPVPDEDEYDNLMRKVYVILHNPKPKAQKKGAKEKAKDKRKEEKSNKTSEKSSQKQTNKKDKESSTLADIPVELFEDILRNKFRSFTNGVIIESLHSDFLGKVNVALNTLLYTVGNSKYIHVILLSYTLQNYLDDQEEKLKNAIPVMEESTSPRKSNQEASKPSEGSNVTPKSGKKGKNLATKKIDTSPAAVLKNMPKEEKAAFDAFQDLLSESFDICQFWDRENLRFKGSKGTFKTDTDVKEESLSMKTAQLRRSKTHEENLDAGIYLWVVNNANRERDIDFSEMICRLLRESSELEAAKKDLAESLNNQNKESSVLFNVITKGNERDSTKSDVFVITTNDPLGERRDSEVQKFIKSSVSLLSSKVGFRKKLIKHNRMGDDKSSEKEKEVLPPNYIWRRVLQPEEVAHYTFTFSSKKCGEYNQNFMIQITGLNLNVLLNCNAVCELPTIDFNPHILFPNVLESYQDKLLNINLVYIKEINVLDFGLVFFDPEKPCQYECKILLRNISQLPCDVTVSLDEKSPYTLETTTLRIDPSKEVYLPIQIRATKPGVLQSDLCISIQNNPKPCIIKLVTKPCKLDFSIKPKTLIFDKVPVGCSLSKKVTFSNQSPVNLLWKFVDFKWAIQVFHISKVEGFLKPFSIADITFSYTPDHEEYHPKKQLIVQVYDTNHSSETPLSVDSIILQADSFECQVEYCDHIELGDVRGRREHRIPFTLLNKGQYNTCVTITKIDDLLDKDKHIGKYFQVLNSNEILCPNKLFTGTLVFNPTKPMDFKEVPVFVCNLVECAHPDNIMKSLVIKISAQVFLSSFELSPGPDIHFGYQQILFPKKHIMELKNTGKFSFNYTIVPIRSAEEAIDKIDNRKGRATGKNRSDKESKVNSSKKSKESKEEKRKKEIKTRLNIGCFSIQSSSGEIMPNEIARIEIECTPQWREDYKETVTLYVSEPLEEHLQGTQITMTVTGCEPCLNFDKSRKIFREQYIVDKLENLNFPKTFGSHCVYETLEQALHFRKVSLNTKATTNIYLQNTSHVTAYVTAKVEDGNKGVFKMSSQEFDIPPFSTRALSIVFKPDCVGETIGKLDMSCNSSTNNKFSLTLVGEGLIPKLALLKPEVNESNHASITFFPTYIGRSRSSRVSIQNVGSISAKAILEVCNSINETLCLKVCEDTHDKLNISDLEEFQNMRYSTLVNLQPDQTANFDLVFEPILEDNLRAHIKIHTVNNPFEIVKIMVNAQSYYHDVCIEGLTPYMHKDKEVMGYKIDFGSCYVNYLKKEVFLIKNNSEVDTYKFEFAIMGSLVFSPRVGHLLPSAHKEIIVSFSARSPRQFDEDLVECTVNKIEYLNPEPEALSWDERQRFIILDSPNILSKKSGTTISEMIDGEIEEILESPSEILDSETKKTIDRPEPDYSVIEQSDIIPCFFSAVVDYSSYVNHVCEIIFPTIFIHEKKEATFEVGNNGVVLLEIEWFFTNINRVKIVSEKENVDKTDSLNLSAIPSQCLSEDDSQEQPLPFSITPTKTSIHPNKTQQFSVTFLPTDINEYSAKLQSNIICLEPKLRKIEIMIKGKGLMPPYYFEIEESDYLSRRPDGVKKCGIPELVKPNIIEFETIGTGVVCTRKFNIVNPTNEMFIYNFVASEENVPFSFFYCETTTGFVMEGKKTEVTFTFRPEEFGDFEAYYKLHIGEKHIDLPFLLAGKCRLPRVYFTNSHIAMKPTILTVPSTITALIRNSENVELAFKFLKESFFDENQEQELEVSPKSGKLRPNSEQHIKITFKAEKTDDANFFLLCNIEKLPSPLALNISARCVEVLSELTYTDKTEGIKYTLNKDKENNINFGTLTPNKRVGILFSVSNIGETGFFYTIEYNSKPIEHQFFFSVSQKKEFVAIDKHSAFTIYLKAFRKATLKDFKVKINISYGPTYVLNINAKAGTPLVQFSFQSYDFGYCVVQKRKSNYYNVSLEIKNMGNKVLLLENRFKNNDNLTVDFQSSHIRPSSSQHIPIYFHPLNVGQYQINIPLRINSVKYALKIKGEAVNINLVLAHESDKYINLGGVTVGTGKQYTVQVVNRTLTQINAFFDVWQKLPFHSRPKAKVESDIKMPEIPESEKLQQSSKTNTKKETITETKKSGTSEGKKGSKKGSKKDSNIETKSKLKGKNQNPEDKKDKKKDKKQQAEVTQEDITDVMEIPPKKTAIDFLKILPRDCVQIGPNQKFQFVIDFLPMERIENFSEQIYYEIQDHIEPLCVVKGYCIAPNFKLSMDHLRFRNVIVSRKHEIKVLLRNMGDLGGRFQWILDKGMEVFTIKPLSGMICPSSDIEICVIFEPTVADCMFKTKAKCVMECLADGLELTLEGNSLKMPTPIATIQFTCPVRHKTEQQIKIANTTKDQWNIHPIVSSNQFAVPTEIIIEPDTEYLLNIIYKPELTTTLTPHSATLFLPLPEGKAMIYKLIGQTLRPLPINRLRLDMRCKMNYSQVLVIRNWLDKKQCFKVTTELDTPLTPKCLYRASGNPLIELMPHETQNYTWDIYIINDIPLDFKVIFTNVESNEYMYYEISVNVLPSVPLETKVISTCVRKPVDFGITLENPIDRPVTFTIDCNLPDLTFDQMITIEPYSSRELSLQYCPLKSDDITTNLNATCPELGTFTYNLNIVAKPPLPESMIKFRAELGDKVYKSVLWKNTFKASVEFTAKFDHPMFSMEKIAHIPEGETGRLKFSFEPCSLGVLQSKAVVFSPLTGNYIYPLVGECILPTPKGPYSVKPGGSLLINFTNPFMEDQTFNFYIDSNAFYLKTPAEIIKAKKSTKIVVSMQTVKQLDINIQSCTITAKLFVEVDNPLENIKWVYYIQSDT